MSTRRWCALVLVVAAVASGTSCARERRTAATEVRAAMARTARVPRGIVYSEVDSSRRIEVRAEVEDDLRYQAVLSMNGSTAFEEVVVDDAVADRVLDPAVLPLLVRPPEAGGGGPVPAAGDGWVLDRFGAPSVTPIVTKAPRPEAAGAAPAVGAANDPVLDSLTVFRHVDAAITAAAGVERFNPDDLDYRPDEDPFPRPKAGVRRYDLTRPRLPRAQEAVAGGQRAVPGTPNFRKLSVYVRDGYVVQVLEEVELRTRLRELTRLYAIQIRAGSSVAEAAAVAEARINAARRAIGAEPLQLRAMSLVIDPGRQVRVDLPTEVTEGSVAGLRNRGSIGP